MRKSKRLTRAQTLLLKQALQDHNPMFWKFAKSVSEVTKDELEDVYQDLCLYVTTYTVRNYDPNNNKEVPLSSYLFRGLYKAAVSLKRDYWAKRRSALRCKGCLLKEIENMCNSCTKKPVCYTDNELYYDNESFASLLRSIGDDVFGEVHKRSTIDLQGRKEVVTMRVGGYKVREIAEKFNVVTPRMSVVIKGLFKNLQGAFSER